MDKQDKLILEGIFTEFDTVNRGRSHLYYTEEEFREQLRYLILQDRQRKINRIISKI